MTLAISQSLQTFQQTPTLLYAKGHQDDNDNEYLDLPLEAQLNVNANTEVGYYQCTHPS